MLFVPFEVFSGLFGDVEIKGSDPKDPKHLDDYLYSSETETKEPFSKRGRIEMYSQRADKLVDNLITKD